MGKISYGATYAETNYSILLNNTEIPMDVYKYVLLEYNDCSIRVYTDCSIRVYRSYKRANVTPSHPSLSNKSKFMLQ